MVIKDNEWERNFRKEIRHIKKLLDKLSNEALVLVPDLLTEELNKRSDERSQDGSK